LTVHARPDVMRAAVKGRGNSKLKILGVTVLTSLDQQALNAIGYNDNAESLVMRRETPELTVLCHPLWKLLPFALLSQRVSWW